MTKHVLVVDDDIEIRELLEEYLSKSGYRVLTAGDGVEMATQMAANHIDAILLDVMLPGDDGFSLCQQVRRNSNVPIIMITAVSDDTDQIIGLEIGADDYIAKPFNPRQLLARLKAVLRRASVNEVAPEVPIAMVFKEWRLELVTHTLTNLESGEQHALPAGDFNLLMFFLNNPHQLLDRDTISNAIKGRESLPFERGIDVQLSRLRQRLGDRGTSSQFIKTLRGTGYMFICDVTPEYR
ncbi:response regulator [Thaumasiovibrio subtropicus]|uniref:response regulator n=1 Tax=Thaumasiovibrio subtropicus TaxID=1891207 RepID=UPI000B3601F0|nr:response regulator [Thaumasiovibrio subtropicus]